MATLLPTGFSLRLTRVENPRIHAGKFPIALYSTPRYCGSPSRAILCIHRLDLGTPPLVQHHWPTFSRPLFAFIYPPQ